MSISHLSIFKRSNGFWYIIYANEGRIHWKSTKAIKKRDALKRLSEFKKFLQKVPPSKILSKFHDEFLSFASGNYSKSTIEIFIRGLKNLQILTGDCLLTSITQQHVDKYKSERLKSVSPTSVNIELRALRAVFNVALRWKLIELNPFSKMQLLRISEMPPSYFTKEDFQRLLFAIKENWMKDLIILAVSTGMRRGELLNLQWKDVDLQKKLINIQSNVTFMTKQGKRRTIPVNDIAYQMLLSRIGKSVSDYIFTMNDQKISEDIVTHKFKYYLRKTVIGNDRLHFHSLRHTFASWLVQDGVSLYEVQKLLGHSNISVTQVYSHLQPEKLHATVNRISIPLN